MCAESETSCCLTRAGEAQVGFRKAWNLPDVAMNLVRVRQLLLPPPRVAEEEGEARTLLCTGLGWRPLGVHHSHMR